MIQVLLTSPTFAAFLFASLILAVTPGPGVIYIVTRTLGQGRKAGFASIAGIALGDLGNATAASLGLAALLSASAAISRRGSSRPYGRYITAAAFIGLGVYAALASPRAAK